MSTDARVHDIRFRRDDGVRVGKATALRSFARWSMLRALGAGRGWKAVAGPLLLMLGALSPALVVFGIQAIVPQEITQTRDFTAAFINYRDYAAIVGTILIVFTALVIPNLVCPDRADRVLALYFATAISPGQYLVAKFVAAFIPIFAMASVPQLVLFAGNVTFAPDALAYFGDHWLDIFRVLAGGFLMAVYYSAFGLAMASLTSRPAFAAGGFIGVILGSGALAGIISETAGNDGEALALGFVPIRIYVSLFPKTGLDLGEQGSLGLSVVVFCAVIALSVAVLIVRNRSENHT